MRKKCKSILCMVLAMVVMFTMTACGGSEKEEKDKSDSTQGSESKTAENGEFSWDMCKGQTIQVLFNEHPYSAAITEHIKDFEELTGIKVQHSTIPETNYFDKVSVLLNSGGDNLDIFMTGPYQIWEYAGAGYMEDLDPFIQDPAKTSPDWQAEDFYQTILDSGRWDRISGHTMGEGSLWGLPMGYESDVLVYNKRILEEHGIEVPKTTSELLEAASALQGHSGENTYGVALRGELGWASLITAYQCFYSMWGGKDFAAEDGKLVSQVNSPEAVEMTDWYVKLIQQGGSPTWAKATWYDLVTDIGNGTAAMMIDSSSCCFTPCVPGASKEAENLVVTTIPRPDGAGEDDDAYQLWTWSLAMNSASEKKDASWLFLQYFTSSEFHVKAFEHAQTVNAPRQSTTDSASYSAMVDAVQGYTEATEATVDATKMYYTPETEVFNVLYEWCATIQELTEGKYASTQEGMDELKETLDKIVSGIEVKE